MRLLPRFAAQPVGTNPNGITPVGARVQVGLGEFLAKPPAGTLWHRPSRSDTFTLFSHFHRPALEIGDVIGLRDGDPMPLPPSGCELVRIYDSEVPAARRDDAAKLYRVEGPPELPAVAALPIPKPPLAGAVALDLTEQTPPPKDHRWMPFLVDGRNLRRVFSVPVKVAVAA